MVEISQNLPTGLNQKSVVKVTEVDDNHPHKNFPSAVSERDQLSTTQRNAASKRSIMKARQRVSTAVHYRDHHDPTLVSPTQSGTVVEEDPKRSRPAEMLPNVRSPKDCPTVYTVPSSDGELKIQKGHPDSVVVTNGKGTRLKSLFQRRTRHRSAPLFLESLGSGLSDEDTYPDIVCQVPRMSHHRLQSLLKSEPDYHPNNAFLYYVDPVTEGKVDATLRNEAVHSLRFMHNAFFTLTSEAFCKAVNLIDRFIVKVKVKPKYISCVTAAAYYIAAKLVDSFPDLGIPSPDVLVQISHCGGTAADLLRMEEILTSKLAGDLDGVNAFDFLRLFASTAIVLPEDVRAQSTCSPSCLEAAEASEATIRQGQLLLSRHSAPEVAVEGGMVSAEVCDDTRLVPQGRRMYDLWGAMTNRLVVAMCSLEIYRFRPAAVALAVLQQFRVTGVPALACLCSVPLADVTQCSALIKELYDVYYRDSHPVSRKALVWTLSKRTLSRLGCSSPTPLDTISEDCETDKEDNLQFVFEP